MDKKELIQKAIEARSLSYSPYSHFSFIYDKEDLLCLKDSPSDKGEEIFVKLLNKRIKI